MTKPIVPWIGGKRRLAKHILPLFPEHSCYAEPFAGGAALFFMKPPSQCEVLNDVNGELVNLYRVVRNHLDEFVKQFRWSMVSRQMFEWAQISRPETLTDIQRAARFFYLQKLAFGGRVDGQTFGVTATTAPRLNLLRIEEDLSAAHLRLSRTQIENMDWWRCVERYDRDETLFYLDPPYFGTEGYGVEFGIEQYSRMADLARSIKGKMVVSVNDIPQMRSAFDGLTMETVAITYTVGGAGRSSPKTELVIRNY